MLLLLEGVIMMQISIILVILSPVLSHKWRLWVNRLARIVIVVFIVGGGVGYTPITYSLP